MAARDDPEVMLLSISMICHYRLSCNTCNTVDGSIGLYQWPF